MRRLDVTGQIFARLKIQGEGPKKGNDRYVFAECECGSGRKLYRLSHLSSGATRSCGCLLVETNQMQPKVHQQTKTRAYRAWASMRNRCTNPKVHNYSRYGGRGISICDQWKDFRTFLSDMGQPPPGLSLDRIDLDGNYSPENCRWATASEQAANRHTTRFVVFDGETMPMGRASKLLGLGKLAVSKRLNRGWSIERALNGRGRFA